jgi:hypothetical protein
MYTARPELGTKRVCAACAVRFYDLGRAPARCPACGTDQPPPRARTLAVPRAPGNRWTARPAAIAAAVVQADAADDDAVPLLDAADDEDADDDTDDTEEVDTKTDDEES